MKKLMIKLANRIAKKYNEILSPLYNQFHGVDVVPYQRRPDIWILLGKKSEDSKYSVIRGFADVNEEETVVTAKRELCEKTGVILPANYEFHKLQEYSIEDNVYNKPNSILTHLFTVDIQNHDSSLFHNADYFESSRWFDLTADFSNDDDIKNCVISEHFHIIKAVKKHFENEV